MKIWITTYALSKGIFSVEATINGNVAVTHGSRPSRHFKPQWHETEEQAKYQAEENRTIKIESLEKQIEELKKLSF